MPSEFNHLYSRPRSSSWWRRSLVKFTNTALDWMDVASFCLTASSSAWRCAFVHCTVVPVDFVPVVAVPRLVLIAFQSAHHPEAVGDGLAGVFTLHLLEAGQDGVKRALHPQGFRVAVDAEYVFVFHLLPPMPSSAGVPGDGSRCRRSPLTYCRRQCKTVRDPKS